MDPTDPIGKALLALGRTPGPDSVASALDLLREQPRSAPQVAEKLLPGLARAATDLEAGRTALVLGAAFLAKDAKRARELLVQALGLVGDASPADAARAALKLGQAELTLGDARSARAHLERALAPVLDLQDDALSGELAEALRAAGQPTGADVIDRLRRERREGGSRGRPEARLETVSKLVHALNSSLAGTAEPLYAILRAVLDETGAERGFIMLHEGATLRFERGLARSGRTLSPSEFEFSTTIVDRTLEEGKTVVVTDLATSLNYAQASSARELGLHAALCTPLRVDRKRAGAAVGELPLPSVRGIAGVLYVDATTPGSFGEADARFLEVLADCTVLALRAARAAQEARTATAAAPPRRAVKGRSPDGNESDEKPLLHRYEEIATQDPGLRAVLRTVDRVAPSDANVLIRGESGTGKELLARALHRYGPRGQGPFVAVDCGAVPDELVASELFGHEVGAFTGASDARSGFLERAHKGTLFLDEVGEASPALQAALLRTIQEGEVRRLGGDRVRPVDVRIVAASHRDLRAMVERGEFRHDLLFRLAVVELRIPPLRERPGDVPLLAKRFVASRNRAIEPAALERLEEHAWPGNVRELENVLEAACVLSQGTIALATVDQLLASSIQLPAAPKPGAPAPALGSDAGTLEDLEKRAIAERLERFDWNQVQAAKSLGVDRNTLRRKILRYGIVRGG